MKIVAVTQARTNSTRLPGKILLKVNGTTLLDLHLSRILLSQTVDKLIVATTVNKEDDAICEIARAKGLMCHRGSENDVLDRFYSAVQAESPDYVVRLTSDCPLIDHTLIDKIVSFTIGKNLDYCSNTLDPSYPDGQDVEVFSYASLTKAWHQAQLTSEREHVTPYIWKNSSYKGGNLFLSENFSEGKSFGHLRMTVDEESDFEVIKKLINKLGIHRPWLEYAEYLDSNSSIRSVNEKITRNEGYTKSINSDKNERPV